MGGTLFFSKNQENNNITELTKTNDIENKVCHDKIKQNKVLLLIIIINGKNDLK